MSETREFFETGLHPSHAKVHLRAELTYTTDPNRAPTPAVSAIASAPQNVTRKAAFVTGAPPACAPNPPRIARNKIDVPTTTGISAVLGMTSTVKKDMEVFLSVQAIAVSVAGTGNVRNQILVVCDF